LKELNKQVKAGDLVSHNAVWHDYGVGLMICKTGKIDTWGWKHDPDEHMRWWVSWTNAPSSPESNGCHITYESDVTITHTA